MTERTGYRRIAAALAICAAATVAELVGGALTHSLALTADGLHSLIHVSALAVALWGVLGSGGGQGRVSDQAATINAVVILALAVLLALESLGRLTGPTERIKAVAYGPALVVTGLGLAANLATALALGEGHPEDLNHRAVLIHMLGDAAVAVLALIGLGAGDLFGWAWADPAAGLGGAVLLSVLGRRLLKRTLSVVSPVALKP